ncbi:MAG TPA: cell division protein FtsL [Candidatus Aphodousia faecigallinarum]|uniref:Cell division protein FtsL n=1 Tax=Candidatus Aphodousia faecigallinarum TaxID=2840677 RepID=A0A9D1IKL2_9BURK|nr:cell division protein FtsL [Candidatus Aphodousia faecigallinarum]
MIRLELLRRLRQNWSLVSIVLLTILVVWLALLIVNNQYKVRALISEIEQEQEQSRRLLDEQREINIELAKVTLPGYIASGAREMGLEPARNENTVILQPKPVPRFVTRKEGDQS